MELLITNIRAISERDNLDQVCDILVQEGKIAEIGAIDPGAHPKAERIDGTGLCLAPGLVDVFACATEPEAEGLESVLSLARAAACGGYTAVCVHTGAQTPAEVEHLCELSHYASCEILPAARMARGKELLNYDALKMAGAKALYNDEGVDNPLVMRNALFRARKHKMVLMSRCRDRRLYGEGLIREGNLSRLLEMQSVPVSAETVAVARDLILARESGSPIHLAHISTADSVDLIREAKERGIPVTASTEPHYIALRSNETQGFNTLAKLDPPLGNPDDLRGLIDGLKAGYIDFIASGHVPVPKSGKMKSFINADFGASSLETSLAVCLTYLYHTGVMTLPELVTRMSTAPAEFLGVHGGRLRVGDDADLVLFDPNEKWTVRGADFVSQGKNTPFEGKELTGRVRYTIKAGQVLVAEGALK